MNPNGTIRRMDSLNSLQKPIRVPMNDPRRFSRSIFISVYNSSAGLHTLMSTRSFRDNKMANQNSKYVWPLIGAVILVVLVALYIDDRRKLAQEESSPVSSEQADPDMNMAGTAVPAADEPKAGNTDAGRAGAMTSRMVDLTSNAEAHKGFSGSIESYLGSLEAQDDSPAESTSSGISEYLESSGN